MQKNGSTLIIKALTWARDSHALFDYEAREVAKATLKTNHDSYLFRTGENVMISYDPSDLTNPGSRYLCKIQIIDGFFTVAVVDSIDANPLTRNEFEKIWLCVRSLQPSGGIKGYKLCEGDVIRLGRVKYRVKELKGGTGSKKGPQFSLSDALLGLNVEENSEESDGITYKLPCRVCLSEVYTPNNPLISPCKCDGTMKYIHLKCLQQCLRSKLATKSSDHIISLSWKKLCCELCMKPYPYKLAVGQEIVELIEIPKPPNQYVILESLKKDKNSSKGLHVVSLYNNNSIKIGRAHDCDLRISDISASRLHAILKYHDRGFYIEDQGSKFGTLIQVKRPIALETNDLLSIQCGRSMLTFTTKKPWNLIPACFRSSASPFELFNAPISPGKIPLLPINTGIPLSINDPQDLLSIAGARPVRPEKYKEHNNLLFQHYQLGLNSSCEDEQGDEQSIEEVEIAELPDDLLDIPMNPSCAAGDKLNKSFS